MNKGIYLKTADIYLRFPEIMEEECNDLAEFLEDEHIVYEGATDIVYDLQQENQKLKKQYCERTDCSGRLGNSKKVEQLEKENQRLKEIEKEHRTMNGELRVENKELKKQLEATEEIVETHMKKWKAMENQQKEFVEFLEKMWKETQDIWYIKILNKYNEIIGDKE